MSQSTSRWTAFSYSFAGSTLRRDQARSKMQSIQGRIQVVRLGEVISVTFGSQVSLRVHSSMRDEVFFITLLWQNSGRQNGLISPMLFSELFKIMVKEVTFVGFTGAIAPLESLHLVLRRLLSLASPNFPGALPTPGWTIVAGFSRGFIKLTAAHFVAKCELFAKIPSPPVASWIIAYYFSHYPRFRVETSWYFRRGGAKWLQLVLKISGEEVAEFFPLVACLFQT